MWTCSPDTSGQACEGRTAARRPDIQYSCRLAFVPTQFPPPIRPHTRQAESQPRPHLLIRMFFLVVSTFPPALALVPLVQQPMRERGQKDMNCDAGDRDQEERREHSWNIEAKTRFDDAVGETRALAGR